MEMETKLDSRQGQFPASFPDTFKNFFAMMNEDEDHIDLFSNLLEDKVIPRANNKFPQRRYGGSLRCTTNPHNRQGLEGHSRDASGTAGGGGGLSGLNHNVGRSNSFRFNRPRNVFSTSSSGLNSLEIAAAAAANNTAGERATCIVNCGKLSGSSNSLLCKHVKYCCLHQQQHHQQQQQQLQQKQQQQHLTHATNQQQQQHHSLYHQQQPSIHYSSKSYQQQQQQPHINDYQSTTANSQHNTNVAATRLGPDGEDNTTGGPSTSLSNGIANGHQLHHTNHHCYQQSHFGKQQPQQQQQQQQQLPQSQKRHSIILERAFDFDASCDESDTISTTSSTPTATVVPYNILKPILKQPQQPTQIHVVQQTTNTIQPKSILKDNTQHHQQQQQLLMQQQQSLLANANNALHRTLPQPPRNAGMGAFHTKETALQRIQQQSGLLVHNSRTNLSNLNESTAGMLGGVGGIATSSLQQQQQQHYPMSLSTSMGGAMGSRRSCSTFSMNTIGGGGGAAGESIGMGILTNNNIKSTTKSTQMLSSNNNGTFAPSTGFLDLHSPPPQPSPPTAPLVPASIAQSSTTLHMTGGVSGGGNYNKFNETLINTHANSLSSTQRGNLQSLRQQKSPILNRRRSSSIVANLLTTDFQHHHQQQLQQQQQQQQHLQSASNNTTEATSNNDCTNISALTHSNTRERLAMAKSPVTSKPSRINLIPVDTGGVLTFQQAMSGAVSPQYSATSPLYNPSNQQTLPHTLASVLGGVGGGGGGGMGTAAASSELDMLLEDTTATTSPTSTICLGMGGAAVNVPCVADSPTGSCGGHSQMGDGIMGGDCGCIPHIDDMDSPTAVPHERIAGVGSSIIHGGSSATIAQLGSRQRQRMRTSSMPAESRKPRLADTRRQAIHCADLDLEYYRLRSFSITSHGVCNLGDSLRSRRSRSINSVTSTATSNSGKDRHNSNASRTSGDVLVEHETKSCSAGGGGAAGAGGKTQIPVYKIAMLGAAGVGKTTLTYQFTTSDYICAYDLSLDDDYGQKTVSVLVDGIETDLEIIDHPACEMSAEAFCSTYNIDLFVVVYSVVDRNSFKQAEKILQYLKENEMLLTRGAILVGNKTDLERHREVNRQMARKLAKEVACKFIETSSGLDHNVDELLVGIVAQVKLNPQRLRQLSEKDRQRLNLQNAIQKHRRIYNPPRRMVRQMSMCQADEDDGDDDDDDDDEDNVAIGNKQRTHEDDNENGHDENQSNNIMLIGDEGIGTGSERTASTSLSSNAGKSNTSSNASTTKGPVRKTTKRTLNLESILKMGESELEDEEEAQRIAQSNYQFFNKTQPKSKFELLTSGAAQKAANNRSGSLTKTRTPFGSVSASPKSRKSYESSNQQSSYARQQKQQAQKHQPPPHHYSDSGLDTTQSEDNLLNDCNRKTVSKLTSRTKVFLSSVLRFKKAINVTKRRNSSSCSDLFVI